jgi:hypothetical protein
LVQIAYAIWSYHNHYKRFPTEDICDAEGKPLLSWRVRLLPFLEADHRYKQFHLLSHASRLCASLIEAKEAMCGLPAQERASPKMPCRSSL